MWFSDLGGDLKHILPMSCFFYICKSLIPDPSPLPHYVNMYYHAIEERYGLSHF